MLSAFSLGSVQGLDVGRVDRSRLDWWCCSKRAK